MFSSMVQYKMFIVQHRCGGGSPVFCHGAGGKSPVFRTCVWGIDTRVSHLCVGESPVFCTGMGEGHPCFPPVLGKVNPCFAPVWGSGHPCFGLVPMMMHDDDSSWWCLGVGCINSTRATEQKWFFEVGWGNFLTFPEFLKNPKRHIPRPRGVYLPKMMTFWQTVFE